MNCVSKLICFAIAFATAILLCLIPSGCDYVHVEGPAWVGKAREFHSEIWVPNGKLCHYPTGITCSFWILAMVFVLLIGMFSYLCFRREK